MVKLYFYKDDENAIIPSKRMEDAGYDVYMLKPGHSVEIKPGETKMLDTGLKASFPINFVLLGRERGSTGTKGLRFGAGVIDSGYRGRIMIPINNTSNKPIVFLDDEDFEKEKDRKDIIPYSQSKAIGQLLLVPVVHAEIIEVNKKTYDTFTSERGEGMLGSTKK